MSNIIKNSIKKSPPKIFHLALISLSILLLMVNTSFADVSAAETGEIKGDIFGRKAKWYHAYLSLYGAYDDNIFNSENDEESDFITVISPSIQLMVPGSGQKAEDVVTGTTTPGGLVFGRFEEPSFRRFRAYLGYEPWFQSYADNTDQDVVNHNAQAGLQYNLRGGLSFDAVNRFKKDYDRSEANTSTQVGEYSSNLFNLVTTYTLSEKVQIRADYSNFWVDYSDDEINGFRDRSDNAGSGYILYRFRPKTSAFIEYRYIDIDYKNDDARDGDEQRLLVGITRDITGKTRGSLRVGYGNRRYETTVFDDSQSFIFEGYIDYRFSPKTRIRINAYHRNEESTETVYDYTITTRGSLNYLQILTHKLNFEADFTYNHYDYKGGIAELTFAPEREDDYFEMTPSLTYVFRKWLSGSLAYKYRDRNSDVNTNSYTGNIFILKITGSI